MRLRTLAGLLLLLGVGACNRPNSAPPPSAPAQTASADAPFKLVEVAVQRGINFRHTATTRSPITIVETMGSSACFLDYDNDGWLDVLLVNAGQDYKLPKQTSGTKLYHNNGNGTYTDATAESGIVVESFATGACIGDYDNDGFDDLLITGFGGNYLFRNLHNGKFKDVTKEAGLQHRPNAWGIGCAFVDLNRDGQLDIFIGNYVTYDSHMPFCQSANILHGCTPNQYGTQASELYINQGQGKFAEKAKEWGAENKKGASLGVLMCDFDNDGWMDIFIADDGTPNALLHNLHGKFEDVGQKSGVAYGEDGGMRAGMGTDAADVDGDGKFDLTITNFSNEVTTLYHNLGDMNFQEVAYPSGIGQPSLGKLKFGIVFADFDGDGLPDIYQTNGHVHDTIEKFHDVDTFEEVDQIYHNVGKGKFKEVLPASGAFPGVRSVGRSVSAGDFNNDGKIDILLNSLNRPARLLENQTPMKGHWIGLKLIGTKSNRSAIGARVELQASSGNQVREVRSGSSYIGQNDLRVLFNLPANADTANLTINIRWPNGTKQTLKQAALDKYSKVEEPR